MKPSPRLSELPFLTAMAAMALVLVLPWVLPAADEADEPTVQVSEILPWAAPDPAPPLLLARQNATEDVAQP